MTTKHTETTAAAIADLAALARESRPDPTIRPRTHAQLIEPDGHLVRATLAAEFALVARVFRNAWTGHARISEDEGRPVLLIEPTDPGSARSLFFWSADLGGPSTAPCVCDRCRATSR